MPGKAGPYAAHGRGDPQARIYRRRDGEPWRPLAGGLPEPLPAMPYALLATDGRLFAGFADGQIWEGATAGIAGRRCRSRVTLSAPSSHSSTQAAESHATVTPLNRRRAGVYIDT